MTKQRDYFFCFRLTGDTDPAKHEVVKEIQGHLAKGLSLYKFEQAVENGATTVIVQLRDVS